VASLLRLTVAGRASWRTQPAAAEGAALASVYSQLCSALLEHLEAEEQHVMPLVEACVTAKEWQRIGKAAQRGTSLKDGPRVLGMMAYDGDAEVIDEMLAAVPKPMRRFVLRTGARAYAKHANRVYGTPTP
jgi:hypothetical protein